MEKIWAFLHRIHRNQVGGLRKRRSGGSGGGGGSTSVNLQTVILGAITIVLSLIMLGIAIDTISPYLTGGASAVNWTRYPGGEPMLQLFPLIMMIGLIVFGSLLIWLGTKGKAMGIKGTIMTTIVVVVAVILLPIVIDAADTLYDNANISNYTGLQSFLGLIPLLYTVGLMAISGLLGFRSVRGGKGTDLGL
jgi:hypothetical protein